MGDKEVHFFDRRRWDDATPVPDVLAEYSTFFPDVSKQNGVTAEGTPNYLFLPFVAGRIKNTLPQIKVPCVKGTQCQRRVVNRSSP